MLLSHSLVAPFAHCEHVEAIRVFMFRYKLRPAFTGEPAWVKTHIREESGSGIAMFCLHLFPVQVVLCPVFCFAHMCSLVVPRDLLLVNKRRTVYVYTSSTVYVSDQRETALTQIR
jgi:hypothetical protein